MTKDNSPLIVALAGNPNSGKTTLFNNLTGANQHVGNYPGVTVEKKEGFVKHNSHNIKLIDLPGTYSLSAYSIEEIVTRNYIIKNKPNVVVNIVDASNLERNLYLSTQLIELGIPVIIALNMSDMARSHGINIDTELLSRLLGVPVIPTIGHKKKGMDKLLEAIISLESNDKAPQPPEVNYGKEFEEEICGICRLLSKDGKVFNGYQPRWVALKLLEDDQEIQKLVEALPDSEKILETVKTAREKLETLIGDETVAIISDRRYGFISGACSEAITLTGEHRHDISDKIDLALIHPVLGLPIFAGLMWLMFNLTFALGEAPMGWIESGVSFISDWLSSALPEGLISSLLVDGIIGGVGGVLVFLPNIMLLFFSIAILEDTGYMARAAFVMDRIMHKIGLHGKSFIPMLIGFGCTVPAYMGSRILEDKTDRLITLHVTTFMSCGARLPVYILVCGAFWPENAGNVIFSIYVLGILVAISMVKVLRLTRFKGLSAPFIMELPPYRIPTFRSLLIHMWERSWLYLRKAGTVILGISIIMWFLMTFPEKETFSQDYESLIQNASTHLDTGVITKDQKDSLVSDYNNQMSAESIEYSFAGRMGKFIEPVIEPLGFDWRLGIAILSGFAAKEVVVATMGTVYGVGETDEKSESLRANLANDPLYSPLVAYSFLIFVLLYMPCMAAMAVFLRESGSWKEVFYQFLYSTGLAYGLSFIVYQCGKLIGLV
ncbi:MAG: ferrous iron transport protein B [candidate division Zixibacteria bacterium]|nr:ferrous iron transport protein B [candidate division Zixibacteria bacterium]